MSGGNGQSETGHKTWREALEAAIRADPRPTVRFLQLATVRPDGAPANRTVVFRGFVEGTDRLILTCDVRSAKVRELRARPAAAACWYFHEAREQFRLRGSTRVRSEPGDELREHMWRALSEPSRGQFAWPEPGLARSDPAEFEGAVSAETPATTFALLILDPTEVDRLRLTGRPHTREVWTRRDGGWQARAINP